METKKSKSLLVRLFTVLTVLFCCLSLALGLIGCGEPVKGIKSTMINEKGELVITYTDDTSDNLGVVVGQDGEDGEDGQDGQDGKDGQDGEDGKDGEDKVSLKETCLDGADHILVNHTIKYSNCFEEGLVVSACLTCKGFEVNTTAKNPEIHGEYQITLLPTAVPGQYYEGIKFVSYGESAGDSKEATCSEPGYAHEICSKCRVTLSDNPTPALNHNITDTNPMGSYVHFCGALEDGNICEDGEFEGYVCTECGEVYNNTEDATDPMNPVYTAPVNGGAHTADNTWTYVNGVKPTLEAGAQITGVCTYCGETKVIDIPALTDNAYQVSNSAASCTVPSKTTYTANFYGFDVVVDIEGSVVHTVLVGGQRVPVDLSKVYSKEEALALGMRIVNNVQLPTCQDKGMATFNCVDCQGDSYAFAVEVKGSCEIDPDIAGVVTNPTCTSKGYTTYVCKVCGDEIVKDYKDEIPHAWELKGREGLTLTFECSMCHDETIIDNATKDPSSYPAKCNADGLDIYNYTDPNGDPDTFEVVLPATGKHKLAGFDIELDVNKTYSYSEIAALIGNGLRFVNDEAPASCQEAGNAVFACEHCSTNNDVLMIKVYADHKFTSDPAKVTDPTCQADGYTTKFCSVCQKDIVIATEDKIACDYQFVSGEEVNGVLTITFKCSMCEDVQVINNAVLNEGKSTAPTCKDAGEDVYDYVDLDGNPQEFPVTVPATGLHVIDGFDTKIDLSKTYSYSEIADMIGHGLRFVNDEAPASCQDAGKAVFQCKVCSTAEDVLMISVYADHKLGGVQTKLPTCHEEGYDYKVCSTCPADDNIHIIEGTTVSATGCNYGEPEFNEETEEFTFTCTVCDENCAVCGGKLVISPKQIVVNDPTCTEDGYTRYYYGDGADDYVQVKIDALGHSAEGAIELSWQMEIDGELYNVEGYVCVRNNCGYAVITSKTLVEADA